MLELEGSDSSYAARKVRQLDCFTSVWEIVMWSPIIPSSLVLENVQSQVLCDLHNHKSHDLCKCILKSHMTIVADWSCDTPL